MPGPARGSQVEYIAADSESEADLEDAEASWDPTAPASDDEEEEAGDAGAEVAAAAAAAAAGEKARTLGAVSVPMHGDRCRAQRERPSRRQDRGPA